MKKILSLILVLASVLVLAFALTACGGTDTPDESEAMTYDEYVAAEVGSVVTVDAYVQAKQGWWEDEGVGKATLYLQDEDGAYFVYELPISEADYNKLTDGKQIKVTGKKAEYAGEIEIYDAEATYEILDGTWKAEALDVTALLGTDDLIKHQNKLVSFKGLTVVASEDAEGNEKAWLYKWNGSGDEGSDLYFNVSDGKNTYTFTVESYLCGTDTEVYKTVKTLKIGDNLDLEGFLYWYDGVNPHITSVTKNITTLSYDEYVAAEVGATVRIEAYVQAKQGWWEDEGVGKATLYLQDEDGAYFVYELPISEEDYNKLTDGKKIKVTGKKAEYAGEIEIYDAEATYEILDGNWVAEALDVTALLGTDDLIKHQNKLVSFKGLTVVASEDAEGNEKAWLYKWNGSGDEGSDLYFNVTDGKNTYTFTVESYLCGTDSDVYKAVKTIEIGDTLDMVGFLYWYNGVNPHITSVEITEAE